MRVFASGLLPSDTKGCSGWSGGAMPYPRIIPHQDGAGVIDAVGDGVDPSRIGERVWVYEAQRGRAGGTAATYTVLPSAQAVRLPDGVPFEVGACLGVPAITAHRCLSADGPLNGEWVLVQGGGGAVGSAAILLAKWARADVAATVSRPEQADVARAAGAEVVINRREEDVAARVRAASGGGVARIVDVALADNIESDLACLAVNGVITAYASDDADARLTVPFRRAMMGGVVIRLVFVYAMPEQAHRDAARDINAALVAGDYRPHIGLRLPLDRVAEGHEAQDGGKLVGKVVFDLP